MARDLVEYTLLIWRIFVNLFFVAKNDFNKNETRFQPFDEAPIAIDGSDDAPFRELSRSDVERPIFIVWVRLNRGSFSSINLNRYNGYDRRLILIH